ncbi:hypothetical protein RIF29_29518 [Crotalaria pallida]|uniref:Uncharacterized protein n=1 Tax=Crotalaria pallida TaxID=3830 RepID=A0AAN9EFM7_CROPI
MRWRGVVLDDGAGGVSVDGGGAEADDGVIDGGVSTGGGNEGAGISDGGYGGISGIAFGGFEVQRAPPNFGALKSWLSNKSNDLCFYFFKES